MLLAIFVMDASAVTAPLEQRHIFERVLWGSENREYSQYAAIGHQDDDRRGALRNALKTTGGAVRGIAR